MLDLQELLDAINEANKVIENKEKSIKKELEDETKSTNHRLTLCSELTRVSNVGINLRIQGYRIKELLDTRENIKEFKG